MGKGTSSSSSPSSLRLERSSRITSRILTEHIIANAPDLSYFNSAVSGISGTPRSTYNKLSAGLQYTRPSMVFVAGACVFCGERCSISWKTQNMMKLTASLASDTWHDFIWITAITTRASNLLRKNYNEGKWKESLWWKKNSEYNSLASYLASITLLAEAEVRRVKNYRRPITPIITTKKSNAGKSK